MSTKPAIPSTIAQEADRLEAEIVAARLTDDQELALWDTYERHGFAPARHVLSAMKEARSPLRIRQKAAPGMTTIELPIELATALAAARADEGDGKIIALLNQVAGARVSVTGAGQLNDSQKPRAATKGAPPSGVVGAARQTMPHLYAPESATTKAASVGDTVGDIARRSAPQLYKETKR